MVSGKTPDLPAETPPVSVVMTIRRADAAVSAINRLRTLEDSVRISLRGERSAVLHVLSTVVPQEGVADSVQVSLLAGKSAALSVLKGITPSSARDVSAVISLRGSRPAGGS